MRDWLKIMTVIAAAILLFFWATPPARAAALQGETAGTLPILDGRPGAIFAIGQTVRAMSAGVAAAAAVAQLTAH